MARKNSMLDDDFLDDASDDELDSSRHERWAPPEPVEVDLKKPTPKEEGEKVVVEISDDTPEEDKGRWVVDDEKDGEPDLPADDEIRGYAKGAQKRISQVTARMHAERRARETLARENAEAIALAKRLLAENNSMKDFISQGEKVLMGEHKGRLQGLLDSAKVAYKEAHEAGDANGMAAAQEQIASAVAKMERAASQRPMNLQKEKDPYEGNAPAQPNGGQAQPDPKAVDWQKKNPWFGKDEAMTALALGVHKQLIDREGITPDQPEYYKELDKEVRKRFPDRFRSSQSERRTAPPVGAVSRTGASAPRTVRITESQAKLARRIGLTVEEYAQQLVAEQDQRDGSGEGRSFTHTKRTF